MGGTQVDFSKVHVGTTTIAGCPVPVNADLTAHSWSASLKFNVEVSGAVRYIGQQGTHIPSILKSLKNADFSGSTSGIELESPMFKMPEPAPEDAEGHALCFLAPSSATIEPSGDFEVVVEDSTAEVNVVVREGDITEETASPENIVDITGGIRASGEASIVVPNGKLDAEGKREPIVFNLNVKIEKTEDVDVKVAGKSVLPGAPEAPTSEPVLVAQQDVPPVPERKPVFAKVVAEGGDSGLAPSAKGQKQAFNQDDPDATKWSLGENGKLSSYFDHVNEQGGFDENAPAVSPASGPQQVAAVQHDSNTAPVMTHGLS